MSETQTLVTVFYGLIGATGALSLCIFAWGFIVYISRLGTDRRWEGVTIMKWAVRLLVTSIVLIGVLRLLEKWTA